MGNKLGSAIEQYMSENNLNRKEFLDYINNLFDKPITMSALGFWINGDREPRQKEREILYNLLGFTFNGVAKQKIPVLSNESFNDEFIDINTNSSSPIIADKCLKYNKNNMTPLININDTLFISDKINIQNGKILLFEIDNDFIAKRVYIKNDLYILCDENNNSPPQTYTQKEFEKIKYLGVIKYILKQV